MRKRCQQYGGNKGGHSQPGGTLDHVFCPNVDVLLRNQPEANRIVLAECDFNVRLRVQLATLFGLVIFNCSDVLHQIQALVHELLPSNTSTDNQLGTEPGSVSSSWDGNGWDTSESIR